jgi:hypothetical protein
MVGLTGWQMRKIADEHGGTIMVVPPPTINLIRARLEAVDWNYSVFERSGYRFA